MIEDFDRSFSRFAAQYRCPFYIVRVRFEFRVQRKMNKNLSQDIFKAIFLNDLNRLRAIFNHYNLYTWNMLDRRGLAPIHYAAYRGSVEIVSWLVAEASPLSISPPSTHFTDIHTDSMQE